MFFISGILHHLSDLSLGVAATESGAVPFFVFQALGIMIEDAVQEVAKGWPISQRVRKVVGYVWVFAFLGWVTPIWFYPVLRLGTEAQQLVPFSIAKMILRQ